jgi:hypothetical protein
MLEITSGAVVTGGVVRVDNGIVYIQSGGTANVAFLATGSGGLEIADTQSDPNAYTGEVSALAAQITPTTRSLSTWSRLRPAQGLRLVTLPGMPPTPAEHSPSPAAGTWWRAWR